jgi:EmrB/QacA subfamily drug resistance transporter
VTVTKEIETPAPPASSFFEGFCSAKRRRLVLFAAILASSLGFIDGSVIAIAVPAMRESLHASLSQVQWIHSAYLLTLASFTLVGGAMGDRLGLARVFGGGIALFTLASLFCAMATDARFLIVARAVQGLGAAMMVPGSLAVISRAYPKEERGAAIGIWAAASAVTTAAGPIIGGLALSIGGSEMWRWVFAINLPLGALAIWLLLRAVDTDPGRRDTKLDLPGALLATLALGALSWGLTGGEGHILWFYLALGAAGFAAFLWVEHRSPAPMVDLTLFQSRAFATANAVTLIFYFAFSTIMFFLPMVVIAGWGFSEIDAAAAFAPLSVFIGGFSSRAGRLADRIGARPLLSLGALIVALAFAGLALLFPNQAFWTQVLPCTTLMGAGMALIVAPLSTAVMTSVGDAHAGAASGINNALGRMAGLLSVVAMGSLAAVVYADLGGPLSFGASDGSPAHVAAMSASFVTICWVASGLALASALLCWFGLPRRHPI